MSSNGEEIVLLRHNYETPQRNLQETLGACFPAGASSREKRRGTGTHLRLQSAVSTDTAQNCTSVYLLLLSCRDGIKLYLCYLTCLLVRSAYSLNCSVL